MNTISKAELSFYQKTGELFYAVAAADKIVRTQEFDTLKEVVNTLWRPMEHYEDEFGEDAAYQMEIVFDWLDYESLDAEDCFDDFKDFYHNHPSLFSEKRKQLILKTAHKIAASFSGKNKSELTLLGKIQLLFFPENEIT